MYVVWREKPVKGSGGGPFLAGDPEYRESLESPAWWNLLRCTHGGSGRVARTALVMASERIDGKPRQKLLHRFPTIRSCCLANPEHRALWWHDVDNTFRGWDQSTWDSPLCLDLSRDRKALLARLAEVAPRPGRAAAAAMARRVAEVATERRRESEEFWASHQAEQERLREEERRRQQERGHRASAGGGGAGMDPYTVLGLAPGATFEQVRAAHRDLAKRHHPDRGGDAGRFRSIQAAYERLRTVLQPA